MNRFAIGALCIAAGLISAMEVRHRSVSAFALEQMEKLFNVVEHVLHLA